MSYQSEKHELLKVLDLNPGWEPLRKALEEGAEYVNWTRNNCCLELDHVSLEEGHGCYDVDGNPKSRNFHAYLQEVIQPLILKGEISDGSHPPSHDDRKLRWSSTHHEGLVDPKSQYLRLAVGPTWYQRCQADIQREHQEAIKLMLHGLQCHEDPYAFFACGMGIVAIPITRDGHALIGKRVQTSEYSNYLCSVAGWLSFAEDIGEINLYDELERELHEEIHLSAPIDRKDIQLIGLAGHPLTGETDLVVMVQTELTDDHFAQNNWPEHKQWFSIQNRNQAEDLLRYGKIKGVNETFKTMFSSRMGLEFLIQNHWEQ